MVHQLRQKQSNTVQLEIKNFQIYFGMELYLSSVAAHLKGEGVPAVILLVVTVRLLMLLLLM